VWDEASLAWRTDVRSGLVYSTWHLGGGDRATGLVCRVARSGPVRTLVISAVWGTDHDRAVLVGAVARRVGTPLIAQHVGPGTPTPRPRGAVCRGITEMCVWDSRPSADPAYRLDRWSLDGLDLEGVI
jgi:hypothetical protein